MASFSGVGDSSKAEIQFGATVLLFMLCLGGYNFSGGMGSAYEKPYWNWPNVIQHTIVGIRLSTFLGSVECSQISFDRVQTFHSVLSNMFPYATDHDAGTYYPHLKKKRRFEAWVFSAVTFLPKSSKISWFLKASESVVAQGHSNYIDIKNHLDPFLLKKKVPRPKIILLKPCNNSLCQRWVMGSYVWTILGLQRVVLFMPFADLYVNYPIDWLAICRFVWRRAVPLLHLPNFVPRSPTARGKFKKEYGGQSDPHIGQS